jgi:hypothetical protein
MKYIFFIIIQIIVTSISSQSQEFYKDWRLYKNNEYHFEVQFPNECIEINSGGKIPEERKQLLREKDKLPFWQERLIFSINFGINDILFDVSVYEYSDIMGMESFCFNIINLSKGFYDKEEVKFENYPFNGFLGLKAIYENKAGGYTGLNKRIFIKKENHVYDIFVCNPPNNDYDGFLLEVMNTFKFTR